MSRVKEKACKRCGKELTGIKTKFCSDTCYKINKAEKNKIYSQRFRFKQPERSCEICGATFKPLRADITACSKSCSTTKARNKQHEKRIKARSLQPVKPMERARPIKTNFKVSYHADPKFVNSEDPKHTDLKNAVQDFVAKGGSIQKQPTEPGSKIPGVNLKYGFLAEDIFGFGWEKNADELLEEYDRT